MTIFDEKIIVSGNTIYLLLLAMKGFDAIRPEYNCFISMIISVNTLCGFARIYLRLFAMKGFNVIQPEYNCFISMAISVDSLYGF